MRPSRNRGEIRLLRLMISLLMCWKGYVPLILVVYDYWGNQLRRPIEESLPSNWLKKATRGPARYILPASILSGVSIYNSIRTNSNRSTYICPLSSSAATFMPFFSILAILLDCCLLISIEKVTRRGTSAEASTKNMTYVWIGSIALVSIHFLRGTKKPAANCLKISAGLLSLGGFLAFIVQPKYWNWVLGVDRIYFTDLTADTTLFTILVICAVEIVSSTYIVLYDFFALINASIQTMVSYIYRSLSHSSARMPVVLLMISLIEVIS